MEAMVILKKCDHKSFQSEASTRDQEKVWNIEFISKMIMDKCWELILEKAIGKLIICILRIKSEQLKWCTLKYLLMTALENDKMREHLLIQFKSQKNIWIVISLREEYKELINQVLNWQDSLNYKVENSEDFKLETKEEAASIFLKFKTYAVGVNKIGLSVRMPKQLCFC